MEETMRMLDQIDDRDDPRTDWEKLAEARECRDDRDILHLAALVQMMKRLDRWCLWQHNESEVDSVTRAHRRTYRSLQIAERDTRQRLGLDRVTR